jgi:hypothetical protein
MFRINRAEDLESLGRMRSLGSRSLRERSDPQIPIQRSPNFSERFDVNLQNSIELSDDPDVRRLPVRRGGGRRESRLTGPQVHLHDDSSDFQGIFGSSVDRQSVPPQESLRNFTGFDFSSQPSQSRVHRQEAMDRASPKDRDLENGTSTRSKKLLNDRLDAKKSLKIWVLWTFITCLITAAIVFNSEDDDCMINEKCMCGKGVRSWFLIYTLAMICFVGIKLSHYTILFKLFASRRNAKLFIRKATVIYHPLILVMIGYGIAIFIQTISDGMVEPEESSKVPICSSSNKFIRQLAILQYVVFFLLGQAIFCSILFI